MVLAVAGVGTLAAPASAAPQPSQVFVQRVAGLPRLVYVAGNGTVNDVSVRHSSSGGYEIEDPASVVVLDTTRAEGCTQATTHRVACPNLLGLRVQVSLADGDDVFSSLLTSLPAVVQGDDGNDTFYGGPLNDSFNGGDGDDLMYGSSGNDVLQGQGGADRIFGLDGADTVNGGAGADELDAGPGDDLVNGGAGVDDLDGGDGVDDLQGGSEVDQLRGGAGNDTLHGDPSNWTSDVLHGDAGNDRLIVEPSGDYFGDSGTDTADYANFPKGVRVTLDDQRNDRHLPICDDLIGCPVVAIHNAHSDVENVIGSKFDDQLVGSDAANGLDGGYGSDGIDGKGGDDYLDAEAGENQRLYGGAGTDTCVGYNIVTKQNCEI
jgi:Ca2+-binding RTX toxin-like protein